MSEAEGETQHGAPSRGGYIKVGTGDELRKVELDVSIPKIMKKNAMKLCGEYVQAFEDCVRGRYLSMVWSCREQNNKMQACLQSYYQDETFFEECKDQYLMERHEFRQTGIRKKSRRSEPT